MEETDKEYHIGDFREGIIDGTHTLCEILRNERTGWSIQNSTCRICIHRAHVLVPDPPRNPSHVR